MNDLATWLRAQMDEDKRAALHLSGSDSWVAVGLAFVDDSGGHQVARDESMSRGVQAHIARHDPARVLAEVDAKRRILDEHHPTAYSDGSRPDCYCCSDKRGDDVEPFPCLTVRLLALPYADRDGYREEWRPDVP